MIIVWDSVNKATGWQAYDAVTQYLAFHAGEGGAAPVVVPTPVVIGGVRKSRFLRRAPRLPWEQEDEPAQQEVVVAKTRRKRIRLPEAEALQAVSADVPIQLFTEITGPVIQVPDIPVKLDEYDDDEVLFWLI